MTGRGRAMTDRVTGEDLSRDHVGLTDTFAARRYFQKFETITGHLGRVAAVMEREGSLSRLDVKVLGGYVQRLAWTFRALSLKYLMTGRDTGTFFGSIAIDRSESGFPVFRELLTHMMEDPRNITASMHLHFIAKNMERMGDHVTSVAEQVVYLVTGERPGERRSKSDETPFMDADGVV